MDTSRARGGLFSPDSFWTSMNELTTRVTWLTQHMWFYICNTVYIKLHPNCAIHLIIHTHASHTTSYITHFRTRSITDFHVCTIFPCFMLPILHSHTRTRGQLQNRCFISPTWRSVVPVNASEQIKLCFSSQPIFSHVNILPAQKTGAENQYKKTALRICHSRKNKIK